MSQQALAIERQAGDHAGEALTLRRMGGLNLALGRTAQALELYRQAVDVINANNLSADLGAFFHEVALAYLQVDEPDKALATFEQALEMRRQNSDRAGEATTLHSMGTTYAAQGQDAAALESLQQALAIRQEIADRSGQAATLGELGRLYEKQGDLTHALDAYDQAIAVGESLAASAAVEELKSGLIEQSADVYQRAVLLLMQTGQPEQAFNMSERARARIFLDQIGNARLDIHSGDVQLAAQEQAMRQELAALDDALRQEQAKPSAERNAELVQGLASQIAARQGEYADLITRMKLSNPEYASLVSVSPLTLAEVQKLLDERTTLLSYYVTPDKTIAFIVTAHGLQAVELPVGAAELSDAITELRDFASLDETPPPSLTRLHAWLIAPLAQHLTTAADRRHPQRAAALPAVCRPQRRQTLPGPGSRPVLPAQRQRPALRAGQAQAGRRPAAGHGPGAGAGAAHAVLRRRRGAGSRPPVRRPGADRRRRHQAGADRARPGRRHHPYRRPRPAQRRQPALLAHHAGRRRSAQSNGAPGDGALTVGDVYGLDLFRAGLVVLSACQTQLGAQSRGDDIVGLTRAFIFAGSPSVVASLWSVDDQATGLLMTSFYQHLRNGDSKAEALRAAQADVRARYPHPYYWAAFVLTGDPGRARPSPWPPIAAAATHHRCSCPAGALLILRRPRGEVGRLCRQRLMNINKIAL